MIRTAFAAFLAISALSLTAQQVDGVMTGACSGATMNLDPTFAANSCTMTQAITTITLPAGTGGGRPFLLILKNPSGFAVSGWPSTAVTPVQIASGNSYLRGVWDPTSGSNGQWVFLPIGVQAFYGSAGLLVGGKCWTGQVTSTTSGTATVNYASAGFASPPLVFLQPVSTGAAASQQFFANPVAGNTATTATIAVVSPSVVVLSALSVGLAGTAISINVMACGN